MKKLMVLGGSRYILPVIKKAHDLGIYVITCDYLPNNIAHAYSDEYCNISIIDKETVLKKADELKIDGISSFACDPGVLTAAYVAEKMHLPSPGSYESISILQNKGMFRKFLRENGFAVPAAMSFSNADDAIAAADQLKWPVIVKPTDSAGSKGVMRVNESSKLKEAILYALSFSRQKEFIIEEFIEKKGYSSDSDCFSVNGKMQFFSFSSQRFDETADNPYAPAAFSWPSSFEEKNEIILKNELQRLLTLLNMRTSIYNIETRESVNGIPYIMEVSPRGGGNRLAEMVKYATGADLIEASICAAVGMPVNEIAQPHYKDIWAEIILHSKSTGLFEDMKLSEMIQNYVVEQDLWVKKGEKVESFSAANFSLGTLILKFKTQKEMDSIMLNIKNHIQIITR